MSLSSAVVVVALTIVGPRPPSAPAAAQGVQAQFEAACVDGRWDAARCPGLRSELELSLYNDLIALPENQVDRATLVVAVRARFPMLAEFGLGRLGRIQNNDEREAVLQALDHPSPAIRAAARQALDVHDDAWRKRIAPWFRSTRRGGFPGLVPDVTPEAAQLGLAGLKAADAEQFRYRYFASDVEARRAVFTTRLTPDQVMALVARGAKVLDGTQLGPSPEQRAAMGQQMQGVQQEIQAAMARGDMRAVSEISARLTAQLQGLSQAPEAVMMRRVNEFTAPPAAVRYVALPGGRAGLPITAAASREEAFGGETVLVIQY